MNQAGMLMMIIAVGTVLLLNAFCLTRVLTAPPAELEEISTRSTADLPQD